MRSFDTPLPIDSVLDRLAEALQVSPNAVLIAPPGAGKTTRVPLALLDEPWVEQRKLILLEPRRLAARAAAERMAKTLGEDVGETVGLRVRLGSRISARTRIEVVTEGVFTRMVLDDPSLEGVAMVLFDEFHERSLDADFGLALALDAQAGLREDLRLIVMSATLDGGAVGRLLQDAPVIVSEGRAFPVETVYLGRDPNRRLEDEVVSAVTRALRAESGSILVFLPGQKQIRTVETLLRERIVEEGVDIAPLYGTLDRKEQDLAVGPTPAGRRKIVLSTAIAETSLTIEGVRVVIDSGLARVPLYEPDLGLTRLETVRVSRAAADQRKGRAGRTEPGVCYRLWTEAATGALEPFGRPEILNADLAPLVLDCAAWGIADPAALKFLDAPPAPALREAKTLLESLHALDESGRLTPMGRSLQDLPLPPRLARMVVMAGRQGAAQKAADVAALLVERGLGGDGVDLAERLERYLRDNSKRAQDTRRMAKGWAKAASDAGKLDESDIGALVALAYPDRIAKARGKPGEFLMANGRGVFLEPHLPLAREAYLAVAEVTGRATLARIVAAAALPALLFESAFADEIEEREEITFDPQAKTLRARGIRRYGALLLKERPLKVPETSETASLLAQGIVSLGLQVLPWSPATTQWRERVSFLRRMQGEEWPDLSEARLVETAQDWLAPHLSGKSALAQITAADFADILFALLPWSLKRRLETEAPTHFEAPTGSRLPIDYSSEEGPSLSVRVQELFGLAVHPAIAAGRVPLILHLLSPASRPIQVTRDLPGFWRGSWSDVRAQMRGRYPRHPWPEDPATALPTRRAKPRGT